MKKKKALFAAFAVTLVATLFSVKSLSENFTLYSSLTMDSVEAMSMCEGQGGYKIQNCQSCKGSTCYAPGGEFWAKDCTAILVSA